MRRLFLGLGMLAMAGCGDGGQHPTTADRAGPVLATGPLGPEYTIFTTQQPASFVDASPGWEVGTRFKVSEPGRIVGFRFWRAPGETGTNRGRLWTNGGTSLRTATFPNSGRAGWDTVRLGTSSQVRVDANTYYRVSVNTNTRQAKTFFSTPFTLANGPVTANLSYYGQPTGSMPTQSSYSYYFVDVIFIPDGPLPNLYVHSVTHSAVGPSVTIRICNNGAAAAGASTTHVQHWYAIQYEIFDFATPSLAAGNCVDHTRTVFGGSDHPHDYYVYVDDNDVVYESNEGDNRTEAEGLQ